MINNEIKNFQDQDPNSPAVPLSHSKTWQDTLAFSLLMWEMIKILLG